MLSINKEYIVTKIDSIYKKIFEVIPIENKLSLELNKLANNYYHDIKLLENLNNNTSEYDILFYKITDNFWKILNKTINLHIKLNINIYENWGYIVDEIILNESW
jgi:hypothetical protein